MEIPGAEGRSSMDLINDLEILFFPCDVTNAIPAGVE